MYIAGYEDKYSIILQYSNISIIPLFYNIPIADLGVGCNIIFKVPGFCQIDWSFWILIHSLKITTNCSNICDDIKDGPHNPLLLQQILGNAPFGSFGATTTKGCEIDVGSIWALHCTSYLKKRPQTTQRKLSVVRAWAWNSMVLKTLPLKKDDFSEKFWSKKREERRLSCGGVWNNPAV